LIAATALVEARRRVVPAVVQTHGMVMPDRRPRSLAYDRFLGRPLLGRTAAHLALTDAEATGLEVALRTARTPLIVPNGVPLPDVRVAPPIAGVATEVLFCARLHPRKRADVFVAAAERLVRRYPEVQFSLIGPDGGSLDDVLAAIARAGSDRISYGGALPYDAVLRRMAMASVYVLPSIAEPFPMSLLEAMSLGLPCVCTDQTGISAELARAGGAVVTDASVDAVTAGIDRLLADPIERAAQGDRARKAVERHFSMRAVADTLEDVYAAVAGRPVPVRRPSPAGAHTITKPDRRHDGRFDRERDGRTRSELDRMQAVRFPLPAPIRRLAGFTGAGYYKGRPWFVQAAWFATMNLFFMKWWFPARLRPGLLRAFGADIGPGVFIRHRVRVQWPWKLWIGADSWIGEDVWIMNLEPVVIGANVCISQRVALVAGSHQATSPTFEFDNGPITIEEGAWLAFDSVVLRGATVGRGAVVRARTVVSRDVPAGAGPQVELKKASSGPRAYAQYDSYDRAEKPVKSAPAPPTKASPRTSALQTDVVPTGGSGARAPGRHTGASASTNTNHVAHANEDIR
jgi:putative colanic acid biosynthesis acetyltransferase WcaF